MAVETGTATDYLDLHARLHTFLRSLRGAHNISFSGSGPGDFNDSPDAAQSATLETWTLEVTDASTSGSEIWSVTGLVTGSTTDATTGSAYDNGSISFEIGGSGYSVGDTFTLDVEHQWVEKEYNGTDEMILMGRGRTGEENIYLGFRAFENTTDDYYNWEMLGYIGYQSGNSFDGHPGTSGTTVIHLWNDSIPYWFIANGSRLIIIAKVSTVYECVYLGKFLPYATPAQYPLPLVVAGTSNSLGYRFSNQSSGHKNFWRPDSGSMRAVWPDNSWFNLGSTNYDVSGSVKPFSLPDWRSINPDGSVTLIPYTLNANSNDGPGDAVLGELDGAAKVNGYGLSSEDTVTIDSTDWLVVQNVFRTGVDEYAAIRLS